MFVMEEILFHKNGYTDLPAEYLEKKLAEQKADQMADYSVVSKAA